jgi:hypothetical protein
MGKGRQSPPAFVNAEEILFGTNEKAASTFQGEAAFLCYMRASL